MSLRKAEPAITIDNKVLFLTVLNNKNKCNVSECHREEQYKVCITIRYIQFGCLQNIMNNVHNAQRDENNRLKSPHRTILVLYQNQYKLAPCRNFSKFGQMQQTSKSCFPVWVMGSLFSGMWSHKFCGKYMNITVIF